MTETKPEYVTRNLHGRYVWSVDGELFDSPPHPSRDEALCAAVAALYPEYTAFYTGRLVRRTIRDYLDPDALIGFAQERAHDDIGAAAASWAPELTDAAREELDAFLADWAERHGLQPRLYAVQDVRQHRAKDWRQDR